MASRIISPLWKGAKYSTQLFHGTKICNIRYLAISAKKFENKEQFSIDHILPPQDGFAQRHIGPRKEERREMLKYLGMQVCL